MSLNKATRGADTLRYDGDILWPFLNIAHVYPSDHNRKYNKKTIIKILKILFQHLNKGKMHHFPICHPSVVYFKFICVAPFRHKAAQSALEGHYSKRHLKM